MPVSLWKDILPGFEDSWILRRKDVHWLLPWSYQPTQRHLSPRREASMAPLEGRNCVCVYRHWFTKISGAWPQVWGEKFVPSKSPSFFLYRAVAGGACRKNSILSSCNN